MLILLLFAFGSGLATILAPCISRLLPIVLSSSVAGTKTDHRRPLGITLGIMLSFAVFTLAISSLIQIFHLDPNLLRLFAVVIIGFLGLTMLIPPLGKIVELGISRLSTVWGQRGQSRSSDFWGGFITGISLGIVWSPCAGPILASIATLAATGQVSLQLIFVTVAYVLGVGIPLFFFAYGGQKVINGTRFLSPHTGHIQQVFGVVMLLTALSIYTNYDKVLQVKLLDLFPQYQTALNGFEGNTSVTKELSLLKGQKSIPQTISEGGLFNITPYPAPDFTGVTKWLNVEKPVTLSDLKGKVVLVDFWTYTCINCIRTLPHVTRWYDIYKDQGFVVIGVHTPEFAFEKDTGNVEDAIKRFGIHYPVAQDNDYKTWNTFANQYWPAEYLIDATGKVRRTHFGEGEYDESEKAIQALLKEAGKKVTTKISDMPDETPQGQISPETYLGAERAAYYDGTGSIMSGTNTYTVNENPTSNSVSLGGDWTITNDQAEAGKNAVLTYNFLADKVFLVLRPGTAKSPVTVRVLLDGKVVPDAIKGEDVSRDGNITVDSDRLYSLINLQGKIENHVLKLEFLTPGVQAFAFTFG